MTVRYRQQATLVENILRYAAEIRARSLLDIGAGSPSTAAPLSACVEIYLAVERDVGRAAELRRAGLRVVQGDFPLVEVQGGFDLVLSSHSVPEPTDYHASETTARYQAFISAAWRLVDPGGVLLIVTFKGSGGDLESLREELTGRRFGCSREFEAITTTLACLATVRIERVNSYATAATADDMANYFAPWIFGEGGARSSSAIGLGT